VTILGTGSALPELVVSNDDLAKFLDTNDEWITTRTGIRSRRIMREETLMDLGVTASTAALNDAKIMVKDIDYILCSTVQGDAITPSLACTLQGALGADCPALDINGACSGFVYGLDMAQALIDSGKAKHILLVCSEGMSRLANWTDRSTCVLFGDGAGAVILGEGDGLKATRLTSQCDESMLNAYPEPGNSPFGVRERSRVGFFMSGPDVYKFAVSNATKDILYVLEASTLTPADIDFFVLHQANARIVEAVRSRLKQPTEKFPSNIDETGNTSSASIPILLDKLNRDHRLKNGMMIAMSAFGAGLTTAACVIKWTKD
jgi:3-oxoacyl-(acyl-carrier-protein) synthase III